jgi:hypothetical protein
VVVGVDSVTIGVIIAAGAGSRPAIAHDASGQRFALSGASSGATSLESAALLLLLDGTMLLQLPLVLVGLELLVVVVLLLVLLLFLILYVLMLFGGWLLVFVGIGGASGGAIITGSTVTCGAATGVGIGAGWRPAAALGGGVVGVV